MNKEKIKEYIDRTESVIMQYNNSSTLTNYVVINLLKELTGEHIQMTMCAPCLKRYYSQIVNWNTKLKEELLNLEKEKNKNTKRRGRKRKNNDKQTT